MVHVDEDTFDEVRFLFQRILIPIVGVVGILGNSVSIYVWTRKKMRCTTNMYLTALATSDLVALICTIIQSFQHYDFTHLYTPVYFQLFGVFTWILEATAFISMYIILSFTIERYIAIRYPLKRQTLCTESMAKKVIAGVVIFGILSSLSVFFEHKLGVEYRLLDEDGKPCIQSFGTPSAATHPAKHLGNSLGFPSSVEGRGGEFTAMARAEEAMHRLKRSLQHHQFEEATHTSLPEPALLTKLVASGVEPNVPPPIYWETEHRQDMVALDLRLSHFNEGCKNVTYYLEAPGILGANALYYTISSYVSLIFGVLLPLTILATVNCCLIVLVRRSNTLREQMTNASSMRKPKDKSGSASEKRVNTILIAVVVCFLFFQIPWSAYLIVALLNPDMEEHVQFMCGSIFNFSGVLICTTNFFLYCVLSDKYRKTVRELITGNSGRRECPTLTSSSVMANSNGRCSYKPAPTAPPAVK